MHEHVNKMLENAIHAHMITSQQNPTQKFWQKHNNPPIFLKKVENLGLNAWNAWKKRKRRDRDHLPKDLSL